MEPYRYEDENPQNNKQRKLTKVLIIFIVVAVVLGIGAFGAAYYFSGVSGTSKSVKTKGITAYFFDSGLENAVLTKSCKKSCTVVVPKITPKPGYTAVGWSTSSTAHYASVRPGAKIKVTKNVKYYAITKKTLRATFYSDGLDYIEYKSKTCNIYNSETSCEVVLPMFNKKGRFNAFWSIDKKGMTDLAGQEWYSERFWHVGDKYTLTKNTTLYPNFNSGYYLYSDEKQNKFYKYRTFNIASTKKYGDVIVEFESGVSETDKKNIDSTLSTGLKKYPWLFVPSKIFVLTDSTYDKWSFKDSGGITQQMDLFGNGSPYSIIDLRSGYALSIFHELAHALDWRYKYVTGKTQLSDTNAFKNYYNSIKDNVSNYNGQKLSRVEEFATMVTNFIWHYKEKNDKMKYKGLNNKPTVSELKSFGKILDSCLKEMGMKGSILTGVGSTTK